MLALILTVSSKWTWFQKSHPFIHFIRAFVMGRMVGAAAPGGLEIPHGFQQSQIVLLAAHQDGTKEGRRCRRFIYFLDDFWAAFPWVYCVANRTLVSLIFPGTFWSYGRSNVAEISRFKREVARHSGFYEFYSCALCRYVSHHELFEKISSLPFSLKIAISVIGPRFNDHRWGPEQTPIQKLKLCVCPFVATEK